MLAAKGGSDIAMKVLREYSKATNINALPSDASLSLLAVRGGILQFVKGMEDIQNQERYPHYETSDLNLFYQFNSHTMLGAPASVKWGLTELHLSARIGNQEAVHRLIEKQTSTGKRIFGSSEQNDTLGYNALMYAATNGFLEIDLEPTIQQGYEEIKKNCTLFRLEIGDVNTVWEDGYTALHLAVSKGHAKVAALLIKRGVYLEAMTLTGYTPLHIACMEGFLGVAKVCVERFRNGDPPAGQDAIKSDSETGTPSSLPGLGAVKAALKTRAMGSGGGLQSPIHLAAEYGHAKVLAYLLDPMDLGSNGKGQTPIDLPSAGGWTPPYLAAKNFHAEACKTLLDLGASIIALTVTGDTPFSLAKKTKPILTFNGIERQRLLLSLRSIWNLPPEDPRP
ncbi:ankyrin repeat-containing domain protein, partial [Rhypophila decipiens]